MENITPPFLQRGDTIGIFAPSRFVSRELMQTAIHFFTTQGFVVKLAPHLFAKNFQFAGTDTERASDFMGMIEDNNVRAIICARGGYGTVRIFDHINLRRLQLNPKWVVGNGDITVLHSLINSWYGVESLNAIMPKDYPRNLQGNEACEMMMKILMGGIPSYVVPRNSLNRTGTTEGVLTGGNLLALTSQIGSDSDIITQDKILFLEHSKGMLYDIDRMMMQLKRCGKLKQIRGLIIGTFTDIRDGEVPFGGNVYEVIHAAVQDYDFPVCFGFQTGCGSLNMPLIMGRKVKLEVDSNGAKIAFKEVTKFGDFKDN